MAEQEKKKFVVPAGSGPQFPVDDFPEPVQTLTPRRLFAILGLAIIALGGGAWLIGPSMFVKCSPALLWTTTISSLLQVFLNLNSLFKNSFSLKRYSWSTL